MSEGSRTRANEAARPLTPSHNDSRKELMSTASSPPTSFVSTLLVSNIHCPSCVSYVEDVLRSLPDIIKVDISIVQHRIQVQHRGSPAQASEIAKELMDAAFDVQHVSTTNSEGRKVNEFEPSERSSIHRWDRRWPLSMSKVQRRHIENCNACKAKTVHKSKGTLSWAAIKQGRQTSEHRRQIISGKELRSKTSDDSYDGREKPVVIDIDGARAQGFSEPSHFEATFSIGGMTCASCTGTITKELESLHSVRSVNVNLLANNAVVTFEGPKDSYGKIVEAIEDVGYEVTLDTLKAVAMPSAPQRVPLDSQRFKASLSIEGMTCGSCVGTITRGLQELPFVSSVNIDLIGNSGIVEFEPEDKLENILEKIDDLGYDATVAHLEKIDISLQKEEKPSERNIAISIEGMFCEHCPERVINKLRETLGESVSITQEPTLDDPRISITYIPSPPASTARRFISIITSVHEVFSAQIYHPPTIEERSRAMQHHERRHILLRVLFTFIVAIPTFIIGIVLMSLVPSTNSTRRWFEQSVWAGTVTRTEWALFIMTTPVMFFGADLFHVRAFNEIKTLWRPGSRVPILRRFYRFGSMNLLISAGTGVAYVSSLAVLILDALADPDETEMKSGNNTYFDSVTFLSFFILVGRFLEAYSKAKTGDAVAMLSNLRPSEAILVDSAGSGSPSDEHVKQSSVSRIAVDLLEIGDIVNVLHGSSPPTDGTIDQAGKFLFDESSLTGESKPVEKVSGDKLFAGSVNVSQPVHMRVTDIGGTSMLDQIVAVVREGQTKRAPVERIADVLTGYFVPVITLIAIVTFVTWLGLGESGTLPSGWLDVAQGGWAFWSLEFAIAVFVVACPCGIGLAAPTALFVGGGLAAKQGILVQGGGQAFQEASNLDVIVFDKTGTLTEGKMQVTDFEVMANEKEDTYQLELGFLLAKTLEESSSHPIAKAVADFCAAKGKDTGFRVVESDIEEISGKGMIGTFTVERSSPDSVSTEGARYRAAIGNKALLSTLDVNMDDKSGFFLDPILTKYQSRGNSTAIFSLCRLSDCSSSPLPGSDEIETLHRVLVFAISDPLRPTTTSVVHELQDQHNLQIHMCTGDNVTTAHAIASQVGILVSNVRAGVLPQDKAAYIRELQQNQKTGKRQIVAFVGDGTNDTPALAAADVSIALSSGSDVAVNAASFILLNSDLATVLELVMLARRVFRRVKMNFAWAAVYNIGLVPVAAGVFYPIGQWRLSPVWASAAMAASSVSVVLSSLALRAPKLQWSWGKFWVPKRN